MSPMISIANKPKILYNVSSRADGEDSQIVILSKEGLPLPLILNLTAGKIFLLCNGKNTLEDIAQALCAEFAVEDFSAVLEDVKGQIEYFLTKEIVEI